MEVRDPIHGSIEIRPELIPVIENPFFQRLRSIKQLGFSDYVFPGATHTRYLHSLGVMATVKRVFEKILPQRTPEILRLKHTACLAGLLHDIGHAPLSHSTESVMPSLESLKLDPSLLINEKNTQRQATHEDYTIKAITDSSLSLSLKRYHEKFGVTPMAVSQLITGQATSPEYFTVNGLNYFPLLHQLISSELDCDRMDYLLRDSYFCGVSYGNFDLDWLIDHFRVCEKDSHAYLSIEEKALTSFDDFLIGRFHMFISVYFHYRAVCLEKMIARYFSSCENEYTIPSDINEYLKHDDHLLLKTLRNSSNIWAKRIVQNDIPHKIFEAFGEKNQAKVQSILAFLKEESADFILCESTGRLTKYKHETNPFPIKVIEEYSDKSLDIHKATNLFQRYSQSHAVTRIHLDQDQLQASAKAKLRDIIYS